MKKNILIFIIGISLIVFTLQNISAIGITPGRTTVNFEPGLTKEVSFSVINSEHKDMSVFFTIRGDLNDSVILDQIYAKFSASEESKSFIYTINLPEKLDTYGKHELEIVALEAPSDIEKKGTFVGATLAVVTQLHVYVPYPNKHLEADINVIESEKGSQTVFLIPVINRGKLDVVDVKAVIDIYSGSGEKIDTIETSSETLNSLERKELVAKWDTEVNSGRYRAVATIIYDSEILSIWKEFNVGEMFLEILEMSVNNFELGEIAKFDTIVENKWSSNLKDVYMNVIVYNEEGEVMADFKSPSYDIDALSKANVVAYWDTAGVRKGVYEGDIILRYGEKSTERDIQMDISDYDIQIKGLTGKVTVKRSEKFNINNLLLILLIFLIVANVIWFVIVKRLIKRKKQ